MALYQEGFVTAKSVVSGVSLPNSESQRFLDLLELAAGKKPASGHSFLKDRIYSLTKRCTRNKYRSHHGSYFGGLGVKNVVKKVETRYKDAKKETSEKKSNSKANLHLTKSPISYVNKNLRIIDDPSEINLDITDTPSEAKSLKFNLKSAALSLMQKLRESGNSKPHEKVIKKAKVETVTKEGAILEEYFPYPDSLKGNSSVPYCFRGTGTFVVTGSRGMRYDFSDQDNSFDEYISSFDLTDNIENTSNPSPVLKRKNSRKQNNIVNSSIGSINFQDPLHSATGFPNHTSSEKLNSCSDKEIDSQNDKIFIEERLPLMINQNFISSKSYCINYPKEANTSTASISCSESSTEKHINIMDLSASCKVTKDIPNGQFEFSDAKEAHNVYESKFYTVIDGSHYPNPKFCPTSPQQPNPEFCPTSAHNLDDSSNSLTNGFEIKNEYLKKTYYLHEFTSQNSTSDKKSPVTKNKTDSVEQEQPVVSFENCTPPLSVMAITKPILKSYARKSQPTNLSKGNLDKCISRSSTDYAPESTESIASSPSIKVSRKEDSSLKINYKAKLNRNKKIRDSLRFNISKNRDHKPIQEQGLQEYLVRNENNYMKFKDFENYSREHLLNRNNNADFLCKEAKSIHSSIFLQDANKFPENTASDKQSMNEILRNNTHQMCCQELTNNKNRFDETESKMKNIQNRIENSSTELPNKVKETKLKENPSKKIKNKNSETHLATKVAKLQLNTKNENLGGHEGHEEVRQETSHYGTENIIINKTPSTAIPAERVLPNNTENKKVETLLAEVTALVSQLNDKRNMHSDNITKPKRYSARFSTANTEKFMTTNVEFRRAQLSKNSQSLPMIRNDYTPEICKETLNVEVSKPENIHSTGVSLTKSANESSYKKGQHKALTNKKDFPITSDHSALTASARYDNGVPVISEPNYNSKNIENPNRILISTKVIGSLIHCESSFSGRKSSSFLPEFSEGNLKENLKNSVNHSSAYTTSCSTNWNSSKAHVFKSSAKFIVKSSTEKVQNFAGLSSVIDRFETNKRANTIEAAVYVDQIPEIKEYDPKLRISELKQCVTNVKNGISFTQTLKEVQKLMQKEKSNTIQDGHVQSKANDYLKAVQRSFGSTATIDMQILKNKLKINSQLQSNATSDFIHHHIKGSIFEQKGVYGTSKCLKPIQHSKEYIEEKLVKDCEKHEVKIELNKQPEYNEGVDCPCEAKSAVFLSKMSATEFQEDNIESVNRESKDTSKREKLYEMERNQEEILCNGEQNACSSERIDCEKNQKILKENKKNGEKDDAKAQNVNDSIEGGNRGDPQTSLQTNYVSSEDCKIRNAALVDAVSKNDVNLVRKLLNLLADPNIMCGRTGGTVLHKAASRGYFDVVQALLSAGANTAAQTNSGSTPLHLAAEKGHANIVCELLSKGADVNATTSYGITPLELSLALGRLNINAILMRYNADFFQPNMVNETPAYIADSLGYDSEYLQSAQYSTSFQEIASSEVPLSVQLIKGVEEGCPLTVEKCLEKGANPDTLVPLALHWPAQATVLHRAAHKGDDLLVQLLLRAGASVHARDVVGNTPLHAGAQRGCNRVVKLLIESGSDIEAVSQKEMTPLHRAASKGKDHTVRLLLKHGASPLAVDDNGRTPADWASKRGYKTLAKELQLRSQNKLILTEERRKELPGNHFLRACDATAIYGTAIK